MLEAVERMSKLIEHLRTFSQDHSEEPSKPVAVGDVV